MRAILPLVFLPGLLNTARVWAGPVAGLGSGALVSVADLTGAETMEDLARAVLETAPERFALAGLSMGGYVAFEVLRQASERVDRVALVDTTARSDAPEQTARRKALVAQALSHGLAGVVTQLLPGFLSPAGAADPDLVEAVTAMADEVGVDAFARQQAAIAARPDSRPDLGAIDCPVVVIVGAEDALTGGEIAAEMAAGIPGARLVEIPDAGHLSPLENPAAVTQALADWLAA